MKTRGIWAPAAVTALSCLAACNDVGDLTGGAPPTSAVDAADEGASDASETGAADVENTTDAADVRDVSMSDVVVSASLPLSDRSPTCLACAEANCTMFVHGCDSIVGVAAGGPAEGTPKAALCVEMLTCFLKTECAADGVSNCYCLEKFDTLLMPSLCHPPGDDSAGACKKALEDSLETTDSNEIPSALADLTKGGGWAATLLQCLNDNHCTACFQDGDAGIDGSEPPPDASDATTAE